MRSHPHGSGAVEWREGKPSRWRFRDEAHTSSRLHAMWRSPVRVSSSAWQHRIRIRRTADSLSEAESVKCVCTRGDVPTGYPSRTMRTYLRHNLRWFCLPLIFIMIGAAVVPSGRWRCRDGQLCPAGGPSAHPSSVRSPQPVGTHPCCHERTVTGASSGVTLTAAGMQCFLSRADQPYSRIAPSQTLIIVTHAPSMLVSSLPTLMGASATDWVVLQSDLPPPLVLASSAGRSPPLFAS